MNLFRLNFFFRLSFLFLVFSISRPLFAQTDSAPSTQSFLIRPWAVGQSITLKTKTYQGGHLDNTETVTYSIVDQEGVNGKDYFWVEIEQTLGDGVTLTRKIQVRQPGDVDFENVLSLGIEHGALRPNSLLRPRRIIQRISSGNSNKRFSTTNEFEVSPAAVSQIEEEEAPSANSDLRSRYVSTSGQSSHVQAGNFQTTKFSYSFPSILSTPVPTPSTGEKKTGSSESGEAWGSPDIPIWGLVKKESQFQGLDGRAYSQETELVTYAESGAASKISEKPALVGWEKEKQMMKHLPIRPSSEGSLQGRDDEK